MAENLEPELLTENKGFKMMAKMLGRNAGSLQDGETADNFFLRAAKKTRPSSTLR